MDLSEAKLISPMLDGFAIGGPISDRHGIRCYPAMPADSDKRYIVKVISIPASKVQLDALLLAGAYTSQDSALAYFRELADGIAAEADVLKKLSRFEGFIPFEDLQIVPKDDNTGYDVYILSPYKRSLERHMRKKPMTHLAAVNLGLDLCASMVVCRRMGYLYVDLKPGNIFINEKNEFRIGDLGFLKLNSLQYASLPDKYRSSYTAPEISDAWSSLNDTLDTYAIGMILYQVYNDGKLPFEGQAGTEELPPPLYADYEMAEIILKAISPKPELRWSDPMLMGQALVAYMQRNTVNDVSIVPLPDHSVPTAAAPIVQPSPEAETQETVSAEPVAVQEPVEEAADVVADVVEESQTAEAAEEAADDADVEILPGLILEEDVTIVEAAVPAEAPAKDELTDLSFMDEMVSDDTAPDSDTAESVEYTELSDETSDMLALADELIALEMPEPVVAPEPLDVPIPAPIVLEDEPEEAETEPVAPVAVAAEEEASAEVPAAEPAETETEPDQEPQEPAATEEPQEETPVVEKKRLPIGGIIAGILVLAILAGALFCGYWYYNNYYLQTVNSIRPEGNANDLIVLVDSEVDESLLAVVCTDTYGTTRTAPVENGKAVFEDLNPDTIYQITVVIDGFHELKGDITADYTTPAQTNIVRFDAIAGSENGSVVLNFTVDGKDSDTWTVTYSAEGEQAKSVTFSGHLVTINGLTMEKEYSFTLSGSDSMSIVGNDTVSFTTASLVYAQDLVIISCDANGLTAVWAMPEGITVDSWIVRCYSDSGYDRTQSTGELTCTFDDIDPSQGYTVEVIAQGMSVGTRAYVSANSATITGFQELPSLALDLTISWDYTGTAPQGGWLVLYNLKGSDQQEVAMTTENTVTISKVMPGGIYEFTIQASDGTTVFGGNYTSTAGEVEIFSGYGITEGDWTVYMLPYPGKDDWGVNDINLYYDPTGTFAPGQRMSLLLKLNSSAKLETSNDLITTLYVVRDTDGNLICSSSSEASWVYMWEDGYCALNVPTLPTAPGSYTMNLYFNNMAVTQLQFEITAE